VETYHLITVTLRLDQRSRSCIRHNKIFFHVPNTGDSRTDRISYIGARDVFRHFLGPWHSVPPHSGPWPVRGGV